MALEELERVSLGYEEDLASLKAALTAEQPASPSGDGQEPSGHGQEPNRNHVELPINGNPSEPSQSAGAGGCDAFGQSCSDVTPRVIQRKVPKEASPAQQPLFLRVGLLWQRFMCM